MGEGKSFRDRFFRKKPNKIQGQAASGASSLAPSLLSPEAARSASSISVAGSANSNADSRASNDHPIVSGNESENVADTSNIPIQSAERVVPIVTTHDDSMMAQEPESSSQQQEEAQSLANSPVSLWDTAYDALKESQAELIKEYEELLSRALKPDEDSNLIPQHDVAARRQRMDDIIVLGLKHAEDKKISTTILGHEITIEKAIANTAGVVSWAEDYIKDAAKDLPYASIVIVGVSLVLPLLKNPVAVEEARGTGFTYVISQMHYYAAMESLLVPDDTKPDLRTDLASRLSQLYESIIEFQIRSVIHLYRSKTKNFFRGTINYDNWKAKLESIKEAEKALEAKFAAAESALSLDTLKQMRYEAEELRKHLDDALGKITQILQDQLGVARRMDRRMADEEDIKCVASLGADDPRYDKTRIESAKGGLLEDSYRWIFDNGSFQQWRGQSQALLWIRGDPGKGKTMLVCAIIDDLIKSASAYMSNVCYFFCQANQDRANSGSYVLRGLIYMLLKQQPSLMPYLRELHDGIGASRFKERNAWQALAMLFEQIATDSQLSETYVLIDGLDECREDLDLLLDLIVRLSVGPSRIKWILSSRNEAPMTEKLGQNSGDVQLSLELNAESVATAVEAYIEHKFAILHSRRAYSESERSAVRSHLFENANATFLWVALVCQQLAGLSGREALRKIKNGTFPPGLPDFYERMLQRVDEAQTAETVDICKQTLAVVCTVYRPITLDELPSLIRLPDESWDNLDDLEYELSWCGSFLSLKKRVISVVHQSAVDFLIGNAKSRIFPMGIKRTHHAIFQLSLQSLGNVLKEKDIYKLRHPGSRTQDIQPPDPDPLAAVKYSVVYRVDHLEASGPVLDAVSDDAKDERLVYDFMRTKYLFWLEALGLDSKVPEGIRALTKLQKQLSLSQVPHLTNTLWDAGRFLHSFKVAIEIAPLQLYASALLFSPTQSITRQNFKKHEPKWVSLQPSPRTHWDACMQTLEGHTDAVRALVMSPDDQTLTSSSRIEVRIWDTTTGVCTHTLDRPQIASMTEIACYGQLAAFGSHHNTIHIWNVMTSTCIQTLTGHTNRIQWVKFSPDGQKIASICDTDPTIWIWDVTTGLCTMLLNEGAHNHTFNRVAETPRMAFSQDGQKIACFTRVIRIWDIATNTCEKTLEGHTSWVYFLSFSPDGHRVASCSEDGTIRVWNVTTGLCKQILQGHTAPVLSVAFSPDGRRVASCSLDKMIRIWNLTTNACVQILEGHRSAVTSVSFSADGRKLVSGGLDKTIRIWDLNRELYLQTLVRDAQTVLSVKFSPDNRTVAVTSDAEAVRIWDSTTGRYKLSLVHSGMVMDVGFSPSSELIATNSVLASQHREFRIWHSTTGECVFVVKGDKEGLIPHAFSPDSQKVAVGSENYNGVWVIDIYDTKTGMLLQELRGQTNEVNSIAFSPDGQQTASSCVEGNIRIWDTTGGVCVQELLPFTFAPSWVVFSPDSTKVAACSSEGCQVWDIATGFLLQTLEVQQFRQFTPSFAFSSDSQKLAVSAAFSRTIPVLDIATRAVLELEWCLGYWCEMVFSPDGQKIAASSYRETRVWDTITGACIQELEGEIRPIPAAIFSIDRESCVEERGGLGDCVISLNEDWVFVNGRAALWLPSEYRTHEFAMAKSTVALGCESGQVWFLQFRQQK